jgi:hypothetical protein
MSNYGSQNVLRSGNGYDHILGHFEVKVENNSKVNWQEYGRKFVLRQNQ